MKRTAIKINHSNFLRKIYFAIFIFVFLIYGNGIKNGYSLDDRYVTVTNAERPDNLRVAKGIKGIPEIFSSRYVESETQSFEYRPLPVCTFAIEYQFFGSNAHANHFFNVLIYALSCLLLFRVLCKLLKNYSVVLPMFITFLFIAHPIHTEVVNNIKCRDELLSFLFGTLALNYFLDIERPGKKIWVALLKVVLFLFLSLLCKKTALLFIGLIFLSAVFFTGTGIKKLARMTVLMISSYFIYALLTRAMLSENPVMREYTLYENPLYYQHSIWGKLQAALFTTGYYTRLFIFPYPLCFYYGYNAVPMDGSGLLWIFFSLVIHGAAIFYVIKKIRQRDVLAFGILVYLGGLLPFSNFFLPVVGIFGERFVYFSSLGFCIVAAVLLLRFTKIPFSDITFGLKNSTSSLKRIAITLLLVFSVMVFARNEKWKDLLTLSKNDVTHFDDSYMLHAFVANNLYAQALPMPQGYKREAFLNEAKVHFIRSGEILQEGLKENEDDYLSMTTLGTMYSNYQGKPDEAAVLFKKALQKNPKYEVAQYNLVFCYEIKGMSDSAIAGYQKMVAAGSSYSPVFLRLRELYVKKGEYTKAIEMDKIALKKNPNEIKTVLSLGNDYMMAADTLRGLRSFERAAAMAPNDKTLQLRISEIFRAAGKPLKAREYEEKAMRLTGK